MASRHGSAYTVRALRWLMVCSLMAAAVALSTTLGAFACGLGWASTAVNSNTLPEYFSYANLALKDNGFQKIHRNLAN